MAQPIHTFDVFDTLIARRCGEPREILAILEQRSGISGIAHARIAADQALWRLGQPYDLRQLWATTQKTLGLSEDEGRRLHDLEIEIEHEQVIPIVESLVQVRDGDGLVSDTYLPRAVIRSLLERAGLHRHVSLIVSNDGKSRGWVWPKLLESVRIARHLGDNPHSDGQSPSEAGIPAVIYTGARRSPIEHSLSDRGWARLSELVREVRLANPFADAGSDERYLWLLTCQMNFPLLVFGSLWLEQQAQTTASTKLLFVSRDGWLWQRLHRQLFPNRESVYFFASRLCQFQPSESYRRYFQSEWTPQSMIVDLSSTSTSWSKYFARIGHRGRCCFLYFIDNYSYLADAINPAEWLDIHTAFRTSELGAPISKGLEMANYARHAVVEDVIELPGGVFHPVLGDSLEYEQRLPEAAQRAFAMCLERLSPSLELSQCDMQSVTSLIREFVQLICADRRLHQIYAGNFQSDLSYEQRLRGQ